MNLKDDSVWIAGDVSDSYQSTLTIELNVDTIEESADMEL